MPRLPDRPGRRRDESEVPDGHLAALVTVLLDGGGALPRLVRLMRFVRHPTRIPTPPPESNSYGLSRKPRSGAPFAGAVGSTGPRLLEGQPLTRRAPRSRQIPRSPTPWARRSARQAPTCRSDRAGSALRRNWSHTLSIRAVMVRCKDDHGALPGQVIGHAARCVSWTSTFDPVSPIIARGDKRVSPLRRSDRTAWVGWSLAQAVPHVAVDLPAAANDLVPLVATGRGVCFDLP